VHGLIEVELGRDGFERALEFAREAAALDARGRSAEVLAFVQAQVEGPGEEPAPDRTDVEQALRDSRAGYRRLLVEERNLQAGTGS
jgi:hypothetical protein